MWTVVFIFCIYSSKTRWSLISTLISIEQSFIACSLHSFCWFLVSYSATSYLDSSDFLFFFPWMTYQSSIDFFFFYNQKAIIPSWFLISIRYVWLIEMRLLLHGRVVNPIIRFLPDTLSQAFPYSGFRCPDLCFSLLLKSVTSMQWRGLRIVLTGVKRSTGPSPHLYGRFVQQSRNFVFLGTTSQYDREAFFLIICC